MIISKIKRTIISSVSKLAKPNFNTSLPPFTYRHISSYSYSYDTKALPLPILHRTHRYLELIGSLQKKQQLDTLTIYAHQLFNSPHPAQNYKLLKTRINEMMFMVELLRWSRAYHPHISIPIDQYLIIIEELLQKSFSKSVSSHQTLEEEGLLTYQTLSFSTYFQHTQKLSQNISLLYINSYIHINRSRNILQLVKVYQALRQRSIGQIQHSIVQMSQTVLNKWVNEHKSSFNLQQSINQIQMAVYLSYFKTQLNSIEQNQYKYFVQILLKYLQNDYLQQSSSYSQSFLHLQNIVYCLYLGLQYLQLQPQIFLWIHNRLHHTPTAAITYLLTLYPHEDKITCLKIDIWLELQRYSKTLPPSQQSQMINQHAVDVLMQPNNLIYSTWKYKYLIWMVHSLCSRTPLSLQLIHTLIETATKHNLAPHNTLASLTSALKSLAHLAPTPQLIPIDSLLSTWLAAQPEPALVSQPVEALCELLPYADRHPALHRLYLPYLSRLLELSLGRFEWTALTELYYYGLRWGAGEEEAGRWQMEYVRRYILNEYASMGIRRREIPEDSYFYKILALTTPQEFYKNHIEHH